MDPKKDGQVNFLNDSTDLPLSVKKQLNGTENASIRRHAAEMATSLAEKAPRWKSMEIICSEKTNNIVAAGSEK